MQTCVIATGRYALTYYQIHEEISGPLVQEKLLVKNLVGGRFSKILKNFKFYLKHTRQIAGK